MPRSDNEELISLAKDVALRWSIHAEAGAAMTNLYIRVSRSITWRTVLHSENAAEDVLDHMNGQGISVGVLIDLTCAFLYRAGLEDPKARTATAESLAKSVTWVSAAGEFNKLIAGLSAKDSNASNTFNSCPWMIFLYLFSMSDFLVDLEAKKIPQALPKAE